MLGSERISPTVVVVFRAVFPAAGRIWILFIRLSEQPYPDLEKSSDHVGGGGGGGGSVCKIRLRCRFYSLFHVSVN